MNEPRTGQRDQHPEVIATRVYYVGVFEDRGDAELAARELRERGFADKDIGFAWRDESGAAPTQGTKSGPLAAQGATAGLVLGGIIGAWSALLLPGIGPVVSGGLLGGVLASAAAGAVTGAVAGGIAGALVGLGIPAEEASYYEQEFRMGRTLITVRAADRYDDAADVVRRRHGYDYATRNERPAHEPHRVAL
ncbi:MAG: hypothetical protein QOH08_2079 [Chloroflexota bacterium]|jgi:hypothetical protein|nr:hypothetical protein [Chloroflexota bacterium]